MTKPITMIELFSGIGAQERALRQLGLPYEVKHTCDLDANAVLSYAAMRWDLDEEMKTFNFPSQDKMIEYLQEKNVGYDFQKGKHSITKRTPITKLKQYYIADKLSKNLGDISKVKKLPYADLVTYSFPCTDVSCAGKGEGMANKCESCGHSWPIDFSNADESLVCPHCGATVSSSTRSGLLGQVQRLLAAAYKDNELPPMLLMENVKNLVGKKFIGQFEAWVKWLESIGYKTHWKVLNAKQHGIPQNRERVFAISIHKDSSIQNFTFPETIPLTTRLKDVLEAVVDEKYYLPDERIDKILNSTFVQEKKRIQMTDVCDTLLARDWKDPKCVPVESEPEVRQIGNVCPTKTRDNPNQGRVYDVDGIAPTLTKMDGGNREPMIVDEIKVVGNYMPSSHDASRVVDIEGIAPTVKENHGTVTAIAEPFVVASRGRNPDNPSDRTAGAPMEQRLEPNFSGCTNTITSVQKDNYVCEPQISKTLWTDTQCQMITEDGNVKRYINSDVVDEFNIGDCADISFPNGYNKANRVFEGYAPAINGTTTQSSFIVKEPIVYDDYNGRVSADQDAINTLTCNCGASAERNGVKILEQQIEKVAIIEDQFPGSRDARIYENYSPTLRQNCGGLEVAKGEVEEQITWRIRKLSPKECWRLMGFSDKDHDRAAKFVSPSALYKQAGNSIATCCLISLFRSLLLGDSSSTYAQYLISYDE